MRACNISPTRTASTAPCACRTTACCRRKSVSPEQKTWAAACRRSSSSNKASTSTTAPLPCPASFFRGAYVGLAGNFGTATIGRQFSVLFDKTVFFDPLFYASYSGQAVLIPVASNFIDNAVKYKSREFGGFNFEALAATGGVAGNSRSGRVLEIGGEYSGTP